MKQILSSLRAWVSPYVVLLCGVTLLVLLLVFFRMRRIELDYESYTVRQKIEKTFTEGKELKARKAQLLSVKNLTEMAQKYDLEHPKEEQIIVIP